VLKHGRTATQQHLIIFHDCAAQKFNIETSHIEFGKIRTGGSLSEERAEVLRCFGCSVENYLAATRQHLSRQQHCNTVALNQTAAQQYGNTAALNTRSSDFTLNAEHGTRGPY